MSNQLDHVNGGIEMVAAPVVPAPGAQKGEAPATTALLKILNIVQSYLPPDGTPINDAMSNIIACVDPWPLSQPPQHSAQPVQPQRVPLTDALVRRGWEQTFSTNNPFCLCDLKAFTQAVRWAEMTMLSGIKPASEGGAA